MQVAEIAVESVPEDMAGARVERVNLKVGKLAAVVPDSLRFCFDIIVKDGPLDGAELHIEEVPVTARCETCGHVWTIEGPVFTCAACDSGAVKVTSGQELDIISIEISDDMG